MAMVKESISLRMKRHAGALIDTASMMGTFEYTNQSLQKEYRLAVGRTIWHSLPIACGLLDTNKAVLLCKQVTMTVLARPPACFLIAGWMERLL
jgi:hypothetical protein